MEQQVGWLIRPHHDGCESKASCADRESDGFFEPPVNVGAKEKYRRRSSRRTLHFVRCAWFACW